MSGLQQPGEEEPSLAAGLGFAIEGPLGWLTGPLFRIAGSFLAAKYETRAAFKYTTLSSHASFEFSEWSDRN